MTTRRVLDNGCNEKGEPGRENYVADFSVTGPTQGIDRVKPDIVAPGVAILSAASRDKALQTGVSKKSKIPLMDGYGTAPSNLYRYCSGTSMATPLVTGCAAVLRQAIIKYRANNAPNASLVKAVLLHGARDL